MLTARSMHELDEVFEHAIAYAGPESWKLSRLLKKVLGRVILSAAKNLSLFRFSGKNRCFAPLSMTNRLFQQFARRKLRKKGVRPCISSRFCRLPLA